MFELDCLTVNSWSELFDRCQDHYASWYGPGPHKSSLRCFVDLQMDFLAVRFENAPEDAKAALNELMYDPVLLEDFMARLLGNLVMLHDWHQAKIIKRELLHNAVKLEYVDKRKQLLSMMIPYNLKRYMEEPTDFQKQLRKLSMN